MATVADPKLVLQTQALDARIESQQAQLDKAKSDLDRADELLRKGAATQVQLDSAKTAYEVAERTLDAMRGQGPWPSWQTGHRRTRRRRRTCRARPRPARPR